MAVLYLQTKGETFILQAGKDHQWNAKKFITHPYLTISAFRKSKKLSSPYFIHTHGRLYVRI